MANSRICQQPCSKYDPCKKQQEGGGCSVGTKEKNHICNEHICWSGRWYGLVAQNQKFFDVTFGQIVGFYFAFILGTHIAQHSARKLS